MRALVDEFWKCHDPTTLDQTRSGYWAVNIDQLFIILMIIRKNIAEKSKEKNQSFFKNHNYN